MPRPKPPLKGLTQTVFEIGDAVRDVCANASRIYGAVIAHCDQMDRKHPGAATRLRAVAKQHYDAMVAAIKGVYRL